MNYMIIDAIKTLTEYIKHFKNKRGYKYSVENAEKLLQHYEAKQQTENKVKEMCNNLK